MTASQLAQLFTNLGNPLPYDRLSAIMQEYDVSKSGQVLISWAPRKLHARSVRLQHNIACSVCEQLKGRGGLTSGILCWHADSRCQADALVCGSWIADHNEAPQYQQQLI